MLVDEDSEFEEVVPLKKKELVVCGVDRSLKMERPEIETVASAFCINVGALEIKVNLTQLLKAPKTKLKNTIERRKDTSFYSKLEQSVFFANPHDGSNPIAFDIEQSVRDIDSACLELSDTILNCCNPHLPNLVDDTEVLNECMHRISEIIFTLSRSDMVEQLSETTRYILLFNAEKLSAMRALWQYQNALLSQPDSIPEHLKLLEYCVNGFMSKYLQETSIRHFFKTEAARVGELLLFIHNQLSSTSNDIKLVLEHGKLLCLVYNSAFNYRDEFSNVYRCDTISFTIEPWTGN
jgi:hypothetical protein